MIYLKNTCGKIQYYCNWFHQVASFSKMIHRYFSKILKKYLFLKYLPRSVSNSAINSRQVQIASWHIKKSIYGNSCFVNLGKFLRKVKLKVVKNCWKINNRHTFPQILRKLLSRAALESQPTKTTLEITDRNVVHTDHSKIIRKV